MKQIENSVILYSDKNIRKLNTISNKSIIEDLKKRIVCLEKKMAGLLSVQKLKVCTKDEISYFDFNSILYLKSESNYTYIYFTNNEKVLVSKTLKYLQGKIDSPMFLRIHASYYINAAYLSKYIKSQSKIILEGNIELPVSRGKKHWIERWLD